AEPSAWFHVAHVSCYSLVRGADTEKRGVACTCTLLVPLPKPGYGTSICPGSSLFFSGPDLASSSPPIGTDFSAPLYFFQGLVNQGPLFAVPV
ncbi:hypothetical protein M431DRAFT_520608, partial [Trichoderma harzianum CBS 226.95]